MAEQLRLFVNRLDAPPGFREGEDNRLPHRNVTGWGVQQLTGALADVTLLLVSHQLVADRSWTEAPPGREMCFSEPPELVSELVECGLLGLIDAGQDVPELSERSEAAVNRAVSDFWPWLRACQGIASEWDAQDELVGAAWNHVHGDDSGWRDALRAVGMSILKHNYRNQTQAVTALLTLMEWQTDDESDETMIREAVGREVNYLASVIASASQEGAAAHDWVDHRPLYELLELDGQSPLTVRVPCISAADPQRVLAILTSEQADASRALVADALFGGKATAQEIETAILAAVPRDIRTPYVYRQVSFGAFDPERVGGLGLPAPSHFALSAWRSTISQ